MGVVHYSVANMPGSVPRTSTLALEAATLPYLIQIADKGVKKAMIDNLALRKGLNIIHGKLTCKSVGESLNIPYIEPEVALQEMITGL